MMDPKLVEQGKKVRESLWQILHPRLLVNEPLPFTLSELSDIVGLSVGSVHKHVRKLLAEKGVEVKKGQRYLVVRKLP